MDNIALTKLDNQLKTEASRVYEMPDRKCIEALSTRMPSIFPVDLDVLKNVNMMDVLIVSLLSSPDINDTDLPEINNKLAKLEKTLVHIFNNRSLSNAFGVYLKYMNALGVSLEPLIDTLNANERPPLFSKFGPSFKMLKKIFGKDEQAIEEIKTFLELSNQFGLSHFMNVVNLNEQVQSFKRAELRFQFYDPTKTNLLSNGKQIEGLSRISKRTYAGKLIASEKKKMTTENRADFLANIDSSYFQEMEISYRKRLDRKKQKLAEQNANSKAIAEMHRAIAECKKGSLPEIDTRTIEKSTLSTELMVAFANYLVEYAEEAYRKENPDAMLPTLSSSTFEEACRKNDFDPLLFSEEQREILNASGKESLLPLLNKKAYSFLKEYYPLLFEALMTTSARIVDVLSTYLTDGIIDENFIKNNLGVFVKTVAEPEDNGIITQFLKEPLFDVLSQNVRLLLKSEHGESVPGIKKTNPDVFVMDTEDLSNNLEVIRDYNITYRSDSTNYSLIEDCSLISAVDDLIEMGLQAVVKNNPSIIDSRSSELVSRIRICTALGIPFLADDGTLMSFMLEETFQPVPNVIIGNSDIDNYIYSDTYKYTIPEHEEILDRQSKQPKAKDSPEGNELLAKLVPLLTDQKEAYSFDGVLISAPKTKRNVAALMESPQEAQGNLGNVIFSSLIHGSTLSEEQLGTIKSCLMRQGIKTTSGNKLQK